MQACLSRPLADLADLSIWRLFTLREAIFLVSTLYCVKEKISHAAVVFTTRIANGRYHHKRESRKPPRFATAITVTIAAITSNTISTAATTTPTTVVPTAQHSLPLRTAGALRAREKVRPDAGPAVLDLRFAAERYQSVCVLLVG
jgi:hypothetical protein